MSAEAAKTRRQNRTVDRSRTEKAIEAFRRLGEEIVSVTVRRKVARTPSIAFDLSGKEAASMMQGAVGSSTAETSGRLRPNADLAKALEEGHTLSGRFASAKELFDALEGETRT